MHASPLISAKASRALIRLKWVLILISVAGFAVLAKLPPGPTLYLRHGGYEFTIMVFGTLLSVVTLIFAVLACLPLTKWGVAREPWYLCVAAVLFSFVLTLAWGVILLASGI